MKKKTTKAAAEHKPRTQYLDPEGAPLEVYRIEATLPNGLKEATWLNVEGEPWMSRVYRPFKDGNQFMSEFTEYWPGGEGKVKVRIDYLCGTRHEFTEAGTMCRRILLCDGSVQVWDEEQEEWVHEIEVGKKKKEAK
jgi:hypothetical protein